MSILASPRCANVSCWVALRLVEKPPALPPRLSVGAGPDLRELQAQTPRQLLAELFLFRVLELLASATLFFVANPAGVWSMVEAAPTGAESVAKRLAVDRSVAVRPAAAASTLSVAQALPKISGRVLRRFRPSRPKARATLAAATSIFGACPSSACGLWRRP